MRCLRKRTNLFIYFINLDYDVKLYYTFIYSYRIEQAILSINLSNNNIKNKNLTYMRVIYAVDMHRKAMKYLCITNT